ncbi:aldehyde ferredoxin oxidoreductase family protein [Pseudodesulfovibrio piezophilus]|uniref:Aldehyde ferredoxin oxidoreductase n=1 Tax=Pseudodesulfovibrio piezophilus (strain DSM 21447 / JCM 15486 / C1TLV30) TaxID=1322246 RepID=M1WJ69_PSEP2|nr:aldehyde ferredoxin oxidoreductase C-terminal domain-containing protein [Pseudodesulfovibrio piezophilus]CCH47376.1 Aldehyde ferredoxin oxidoreductase [Pseudodesulfovibrio piezophilus C1TLV30]
MPQILRINTRTQEYSFEEVGTYANLGGRALTSRIINQEVPADCHPLSSENKLVIATGLLGGSTAANSGRVSVGTKSPLTGGIKESNSGGLFAHKMPKMNLLAIILEDKPTDETPFSTIFISDGKVEFRDASKIVGMDNYPAHDILLEEYGNKLCAAMIGPAGETVRKTATIQFTDPYKRPARSAGRGGTGAVMGSKKIKALVLDPEFNNKVTAADPETFKTARKTWVKMLQDHPVTGQGLPGFGTSVLVNVVNEAGALPGKNFRYGQVEHAADISGEKIAENIEARGGKTTEGCHAGCVIQCSQQYNNDKGEYITSGFEYETVWAFGGNALIKDIDQIAIMDRICDEKGMDTIEMGNTIAVAMDGGIIPWGDGEAAIDLLNKVGTNDPMGMIIGNGVDFAGGAFGVERLPTVKGQSMPAYDPRAVKGVGVTYATSAMGADHTAGYGVAQNLLKVGGDIDGLKKEGNVELSKNLQIATAAIDSMGFCLFVAFAVLDASDGVQAMADLVQAYTGNTFTTDDLVNLGIHCMQDEQEFNKRAGFTKMDDKLPRFFETDPLPPHGVIWDLDEDELQGAKV